MLKTSWEELRLALVDPAVQRYSSLNQALEKIQLRGDYFCSISQLIESSQASFYDIVLLLLKEDEGASISFLVATGNLIANLERKDGIAGLLVICENLGLCRWAQQMGLRNCLLQSDLGDDFEYVEDAIHGLLHGWTVCSWVEAMSSDLGDSDRLASLTAREMEILSLITENLTSAEIAYELCERSGKTIKEKTVNNHLVNAYRKLGVRSRGEAIRKLQCSPGVCKNNKYKK